MENIVQEVAHYFSDGVYCKMMFLLKDHSAPTHVHKYDHLSILAYGRVVIAVNGNQLIYTAPACIEIKAGQEHSILAVEDSIFYCIHATNEKDINKIDETLIGVK